MLPDRTIKYLKKVYGALCSCGCLPYKTSKNEDAETTLQHLSLTDSKYFNSLVVIFTTFCHTVFIVTRLYQAYHLKTQKFFLLFIHFAWSVAFIMISWLHVTLFCSRFEVLSYCNGLLQFYGSYFSMPGGSISAKCRRKIQSKPCLVDMLVSAFLIGAVFNTLFTVLIFLMNSESYQFLYSVIPKCWRERFPVIFVFCVIYEMFMPGINWILLLFFILIHLLHLLCTRDYLITLKKATQKRILKLTELCHHYRSIQILHNHYNKDIASYMPLELFIVLSLTLAGNIGTIKMMHSNQHITIPEMSILPMLSILTIMFQIIFYHQAGDLHHFSSFFIKGSKRGLFHNKSAKMCLRSFPPLIVKVGTLMEIRRYTVVKFVGAVLVGTSRLILLFFR